MSDDYVAPSGVEFLLSPFPAEAVQQRQGPGGRSFDYIPAEVLIRRLVDSGLEYSFGQVPGSPPVIQQHGNGVNVMLYYGRLHIPALGLPMDDVGTAFIHAGGNEEQYKSAASDCLKRCARLYGIGLEMWEGDPLESSRGLPATSYQSGGSASHTGSDQSRSNVGPTDRGSYTNPPASGYGGQSRTQSHAPSSGGKEATDKQIGFIRRLTQEKFPMDNNEFNEQAVQQIWTMELKMPGEWATDRRGTSDLIEHLMALPAPNQQPRLQV